MAEPGTGLQRVFRLAEDTARREGHLPGCGNCTRHLIYMTEKDFLQEVVTREAAEHGSGCSCQFQWTLLQVEWNP